MLRIDVRSFARRNAEELRIELIDASRKPPRLAIDLPAMPGSGS